MKDIKTSHEKEARVLNFWLGLLIELIFIACAAIGIIFGMVTNAGFFVLGVLGIIATIFNFTGFFTLQPNEAFVFTFFGKYVGTYKNEGLHYRNPFYLPKKVSLRKRNFNGDKIKVNDALGNPIEISAIVVWRVQDTYQATFDVDYYAKFVEIQAESALRHLAGLYPYDLFDDKDENIITLRDNNAEVTEALRSSIQERLDKAGVEVLEARLNHIAYAPEIAAAMLQRQQAVAIIAAKKKIVEGAVSMVDMALAQLNEKEIVEFDAKSKADLVSNLLIILCGDKSVQPVITTNNN